MEAAAFTLDLSKHEKNTELHLCDTKTLKPLQQKDGEGPIILLSLQLLLSRSCYFPYWSPENDPCFVLWDQYSELGSSRAGFLLTVLLPGDLERLCCAALIHVLKSPGASWSSRGNEKRQWQQMLAEFLKAHRSSFIKTVVIKKLWVNILGRLSYWKLLLVYFSLTDEHAEVPTTRHGRSLTPNLTGHTHHHDRDLLLSKLKPCKNGRMDRLCA